MSTKTTTIAKQLFSREPFAGFVSFEPFERVSCGATDRTDDRD